MNTNRIAIIGAGASGMVAAIAAARSGANVTIFDANDRVGKKILVTGNGRCNLSNTKMDVTCFHSDDPRFVGHILEKFSTNETVQFFKSIGVLVKEKNGGLYPVSETASTVLDSLRFALERYHVETLCNTMVKEVNKVQGKFQINNRDELFDKVIISSGLFAGKNVNQAKSGIEIAKAYQHEVQKILPALVQLHSSESYFKSMAGVRTTANIEAYADGEFLKEDFGELQLANYGVSGIPVFQLSSEIVRALHKKKEVSLRIDFIPWIKKEDISTFVESRKMLMPQATFEEFTNGILHKKVISVALKLRNLKVNQVVDEVEEKKILSLFKLLKNWEVPISQSKSFEHAQVCTGGISIKEVTPFFESKKEENMYFIGEILNVDGVCGGYNLQWAWASGNIAGTHAALS